MRQGYKIHGCTAMRPAPTKPLSWRCALGFHDMVPFKFEKDSPIFIPGSWACYCSRCDHMDEGIAVPSVRPMPPVKPAKSPEMNLSSSDIDKAIKLLIANGYGVYPRIDPDLVKAGTIKGDRVKSKPSRSKGGAIDKGKSYTVGDGCRTQSFMDTSSVISSDSGVGE